MPRSVPICVLQTASPNLRAHVMSSGSLCQSWLRSGPDDQKHAARNTHYGVCGWCPRLCALTQAPQLPGTATAATTRGPSPRRSRETACRRSTALRHRTTHIQGSLCCGRDSSYPASWAAESAHQRKTAVCEAAPAPSMRHTERTPRPLSRSDASPFTAPLTRKTEPIWSMPSVGVITCFVKTDHANAPSAPCVGARTHRAREQELRKPKLRDSASVSEGASVRRRCKCTS